MKPLEQRVERSARATAALVTAAVLAGCAAPGPPKPPSLQLPDRARKLTAERSGDRVILHFEAPDRTTDGQLIRTPAVSGTLCRAVGEHGACEPVAIGDGEAAVPVGFTAAVPVVQGDGPAPAVVWVDRLPAELAAGPVRQLTYRVDLRNSKGRTAGPSDPVFAAAGTPPPPVDGFRVDGSRLGAVIRWHGEPSDQSETRVVLQRIPIATAPSAAAPPPAPAADAHKHHARRRKAEPRADRSPRPGASTPKPPAPVSLATKAGSDAVLDHDITDGLPYRFIAERRATVTLGGRTLELRSAPTAPIPFTWRPVYAPPAPRDLATAAFNDATTGRFAIDLIWQPVTVENLAGYRVYREPLTNGQPGTRALLTQKLATSPAFHDATAQAGANYRYSVTAVDRFGNESSAVTAEVDGSH